MMEKVADEWHVVNDRCRRESPSIAQVLRVCLCTDLSRWNRTRCCLLDRNHALTPHKIDEMTECSAIASVRLHVSGATAQIPCRVVVANVLYAYTCLLKPSTKACGDTYLLLHGLRAVSLGADRIRKRYQMACKRSFWRLRERDLIMNGVLHDDLLPRRGERVEGVKIISIQRRPFDLKSAPSRDYKT